MNAPLKQQSPLEGVGNGANDSIIEALENNTAQALSMNSLNDAMKASLCLYDSHSAKTGKVMTYENLLHCVNNPPKGQVTDPTQVKAKKQTLPLITPFISTNLAKTKESALTARYWALVLDFDKEQQRTLSGIAGILKETYQAGEFCGFTTSSHTLEGLNAFKFVVPLADAVDAHTYTALAEGLCLLLDTDPAQARTQQGFYSPCDMLSPSVYEKHINNGERLSPSTALWKIAVERYLQNIEEQAHKAPIKPHQQCVSTDIFNLINQYYSLEDLLQQAGHTQQGGKWLSPHSSSGIAGGMIFDTANGKRFYSHSSSCPLSKDAHNGHSLDVADVLAVTKYGGNYSEMVKQEAPIVDADGQKQRQASHTTAQAKIQQSSIWGTLLPLNNTSASNTLPYPIQALPPILRDAAEAIAEYVQAPIAMTAQCIIGAISHIAQIHVNAPHPVNRQGEPCSLFLITEGQSGSRKSTSKALADKSIRDYEFNAYQEYGDELKKWKTMQAGLDKKNREAYIAENPPPNDPTSLFSDGTLEAVAGLFIDDVIKNASISSDEAGQFFGGHTMKSDTRTQALGSYTKLFDDGFIQRTRSKSNLNGSGQAYGVRLTFNLQGQHEVLAQALKDDVLREQGFLPRFILSVPENLAGTRLQDAKFKQKNADQDHRLIAYWERCKMLLDPCPMLLVDGQQQHERRVIQLSADAIQIDQDFYNECESNQAKGRKYAHIQPFASRASQLSRRLATVFAFFQNEREISAQTMQGACDIIRHSLNEWLRYADIESKKENDAELIFRWLMKQEDTKILKTSISSNVTPKHLRNANVRDVALEHLSNCGYIKIEKILNKDYIVLNPHLPKVG
ncbi:MAG: DUF3987 domain-containing protein [Acinetobacter sp.]|uniref:DUF3987 domain-containing protein n=1 Tax=Acinetobacter sp. TaxID=472 RepID=UPI00258D9DAF|nr:DUF3987 domain-containing protein [Acinetobacter sp.]MCE1270927.1 DUF3987 domain-containing protein [Acinetobacter sp.]